MTQAFNLGLLANNVNSSGKLDGTTGLTTSVVANTIGSAASTALTLQSAGTTAITVDTSQNVGIGVTSPAYKLDTTGTIRSQADIYAGFVNGTSGGLWLAKNNYTYPAVQSLTSAGAASALLLNPASGNVGLGGTSIVRAVTFNTSEIAMATATTGCYLNLCDASGNNGGSYNFYIRGLASNGGAQANLAAFNAVAGAVYNGSNTTTWNTTSDQRIKKNIVDNNEGIEKIIGIRVRNFEYRTADEIIDFPDEENIAIQRKGVQLGVVAQELQSVLPDCVYEQKNGMLSLSTDNMMWYMINAIKDLKAINDTQAETITALTARIVALESK
jgi:hypothetical protein